VSVKIVVVGLHNVDDFELPLEPYWPLLTSVSHSRALYQLSTNKCTDQRIQELILVNRYTAPEFSSFSVRFEHHGFSDRAYLED
jgi:hypothetical protein